MQAWRPALPGHALAGVFCDACPEPPGKQFLLENKRSARPRGCLALRFLVEMAGFEPASGELGQGHLRA